LRAGHITDMPFWFNNLALPCFTPSASEIGLGNAMSSYLAGFATNGNPNYVGGSTWPQYDPIADSHIILDETVVSADGVRTSRCDFWDAHPLGE
jgi:carboxylesterase type B